MTDPCKQLRSPGINGRATCQRHPPFDQGHHRRHFKQQDKDEKRHLEVEQRLLQIVIRAFFKPAKGSHPAANQQNECTNPPQVIRAQHAADLPRSDCQTPKVRTADQNRPEPQHKRQKVNRRHKPVDQHRETPVRTKLNQAVSSSPSNDVLHLPRNSLRPEVNSTCSPQATKYMALQ
ncbi:hypothetical protein D3C76_1242110 [compost metagenome]